MFKKRGIAILLCTFMIISTLTFTKITAYATGLNGWKQDNTTWSYYINGIKATNWILSSGKWYYLKANGDMATGWIQTGAKWYYLNSDGAMATGWILSSGKWYYLRSIGDMATGWISSGGKSYYLNVNGDMAVNTITKDGYRVGVDGAWNGKAKAIVIPEIPKEGTYIPTNVHGVEAIKQEFQRMGFVFQSDTAALYSKDGIDIGLLNRGEFWQLSIKTWGSNQETLFYNCISIIWGQDVAWNNLIYIDYALDSSGSVFQSPNIKAFVSDNKLVVYVYVPKN